MKTNLVLIPLLILVACSKPTGSSKKSPAGPDRITETSPIVDIIDPLETGEQQQQTDGEFELNRTYNGTNVVLNYSSPDRLGMIRIKGKDAEKLHKFMALSTIKVNSPSVKSELEAKVGKNVICRPDVCWIYIDYKNGSVNSNEIASEKAKAPRLILPYKTENLELSQVVRGLKIFSKGRILVQGMDAKALYSVMEISEVQSGGKGSSKTLKSGAGIKCSRASAEKAEEKDSYKCEVEFNHRTGSVSSEE